MLTTKTANAMCSPHTWGWPVLATDKFDYRYVFPTHVGMARSVFCEANSRNCVPHTRGDGPHIVNHSIPSGKCSPHTWGWPKVAEDKIAVEEVFPTHVGMARS